MHIQKYVNLKFYILFVTLDVCKKYLYSKLDTICHQVNKKG